MPQVLELNKKGIWIYLHEKAFLPESQTKPAPRKRHTKESRLESFFETLAKDLQEFGCRSIKISTLLDRFSIRKRSPANLDTVIKRLAAEGLYTQPIYSNELKRSSTLRIYTYPYYNWAIYSLAKKIWKTMLRKKNFIKNSISIGLKDNTGQKELKINWTLRDIVMASKLQFWN